jgi:hypothetical protein
MPASASNQDNQASISSATTSMAALAMGEDLLTERVALADATSTHQQY